MKIFKKSTTFFLFFLLGINILTAQNEKAGGSEVLIQGFNWESWMLSTGWYNFVATKAQDLNESGIDGI